MRITLRSSCGYVSWTCTTLIERRIRAGLHRQFKMTLAGSISWRSSTRGRKAQDG